MMCSANCTYSPENTIPEASKESETKIVSHDGVNPTPDFKCVKHFLPKECDLSDDSVHINMLPDEIMECIFAYLDIQNRIQVESVCKHWRWIGKTRPWSWPRELTLKEDWGHSTPSVFVFKLLHNDVVSSVLFRCGHGLRELTLCSTYYPLSNFDATLQIIGKWCPNLLKINLYGIPLSDQFSVRTLTLGCAKLKRVRLHNYLEIHDEQVKDFLRECKALECLQVHGGNAITGECFDVINTSLNTLGLLSCEYLTSDGLEKLILRCDSLRDLRLTYCVKVDQGTLLKVFRYYRNTLKTLVLDGYSGPLQWCDVVRILRNLEKLSISDCRHVDDDVCRCIANNCAKLKVLNISRTRVTDAGLSCLASTPSLVVLDITGLSLLGFGIEVFASQRRLETLYAKFLNHLTNADQNFTLLARLCPNLHTLDVSWVSGVSNRLIDSLRQFLQNGSLKGPVKVGLECTFVTKDVETCEGLELVFENDKSLCIADYEYTRFLWL